MGETTRQAKAGRLSCIVADLTEGFGTNLLVTMKYLLPALVLAAVLGGCKPSPDGTGLREGKGWSYGVGDDLDHDGRPNDFHWLTEELPLRVVMTLGFESDIPFRTAWLHATETLNSVMGRAVFQSPVPATPEEFARVDIRGGAPPLGSIYLTNGCADKLAAADVFATPAGRIQTARVCFPDTYEEPWLEPSVLHEAGHVLGLDHDVAPGSLMNQGLVVDGVLTQATQDLLRRLYGPGAPFWGPVP